MPILRVLAKGYLTVTSVRTRLAWKKKLEALFPIEYAQVRPPVIVHFCMSRSLEALSTFYGVAGSIDERIQKSTGIKSEQALLDRINTKPTRNMVDLLMQTPCNQHCDHCHFVEEGYGVLRVDQSLMDDAQMIVDFFHPSRDETEPQVITYPRELSLVLPLLPLRQKLGMDDIYTNASRITPHVIEELLNHGVKNAFVSLHGDQEHHMALTGVPAKEYENTLRGISLLHRSGMNVNIITTIYKDNLGVVPEIVKYLEQNGLTQLKLIRYFPAGKGKDLPADKILTPEDVLKLLYVVDEQRKKHPNINISLYGMSFGPNFYSPNYFRYLAGQKGALSGEGNIFGNTAPEPRYVCTLIGRQYLGISLGTHNVYPCFEALSFPEMKMGELTINDKKVSLQLDESNFTPEKLSANLRGQCSEDDCPYQKFCLGGCRMHAYAIARQRGEPNPMYAGQDVCVTRILDKELGKE